MHIKTARDNMAKIGMEISDRIEAVKRDHPDLSNEEILALRPDLGLELVVWNRCSLALTD